MEFKAAPEGSGHIYGIFQHLLKLGFNESIDFLAEKSVSLVPDVEVFAFLDIHYGYCRVYPKRPITKEYVEKVIVAMWTAAENLGYKLKPHEYVPDIISSEVTISEHGSDNPENTFVLPIYTKLEGLSLMSFMCLATKSDLARNKKKTEVLDSIGSFLSTMRAREENEKKERRLLEETGLYDPLTHVLNRRSFYQEFADEIEHARKTGEPLCLTLLDIDEFKQINDTLGHAFGDMILKQITSQYLELLEDGETMYRLGGDEFALVLRKDKMEAYARVKGMLEKISKLRTPPISMSGGLVEVSQENNATVDEAVLMADRALYFAKGSGKNQVLFFEKEEDGDVGAYENEYKHIPEEINATLREVATARLAELYGFFPREDVDLKASSETIARIALIIGRSIGLDERRLDALRLAGLIHDIGFVFIPESVVGKQGVHTPEEIEQLRSHPLIAVQMLKNFPLLKDLLPIVLYHHEYINGEGYPFGLAGDAIPLESRILSVACAFHWMKQGGKYSFMLQDVDSIAGIIEGRGTKFDSQVVDALLNLVDSM